MTTVTERPTNEFTYAPVSPLAPITVFLGMVSILCFLHHIFVPVAFFGLVLGLVALRRISKSNGEIRGKVMTLIGILMCVGFGACGLWYQVHLYENELPPGHIRVNFPRDISAHEFIESKSGRRSIPEPVKALLGKKIFIKGWMMPSRRLQGLTTFILIKDSGDCCFGGDPAAYDHIEVTLLGGKKTDSYDSAMIYVTGILNANPDVGDQKSVYTMQATDCGLARSKFQN